MKQNIRLDSITVDSSIQPRASNVDQAHADELAQAFRNGDSIPAIVVYTTDDKTYILSEGFHRCEGAKRANVEYVTAEIRKGDKKAAALNAMASNQSHGLKRTNADKRRAVTETLKLVPDWSDRKIAEHLGVDNGFVGDVRRQLLPGNSSIDPQPATVASSTPATRTGKDGKQRPATQPKKTKAKPAPSQVVTLGDDAPEPVNEPEPPFTESEQPNTIERDGMGNPVPDCVADTFGDPALKNVVERIRQAHREIVSIESHVKTTLQKKAQFWPFAHYGKSMESLLNAADHVATAMAQLESGLPYCVCPKCHGEGCIHCRQAGYWPKWKHEGREQYGV